MFNVVNWTSINIQLCCLHFTFTPQIFTVSSNVAIVRQNSLVRRPGAAAGAPSLGSIPTPSSGDIFDQQVEKQRKQSEVELEMKMRDFASSSSGGGGHQANSSTSGCHDSVFVDHTLPNSSVNCHSRQVYCGVLSKWEFFIKMRAAYLAPILPWVMKEGESKEGSSHFDEKLSFW